MPVFIVDSMMGSGKTSAAINMMRNAGPSVKYLYITPYITETDRIVKHCPERHFRQPALLGTKTRGIKHLLKRRCNIVATHALFQLFDDDIVDLIRDGGYTLIMDEVADVIEPLEMSIYDMRAVLRQFARPNTATRLLDWQEPNYYGAFNSLKQLCEAGSVGVYNDEMFVWMFPIKVFEAFANSYLLTYMFDAQLQKYYYDYHNIQYERLFVINNGGAYSFTDTAVKHAMPYRCEIRIMDKPSLNRIGNKETALSKTWYENNDADIQRLRNNVTNYFINLLDTVSSQTLWTTFTDWRKAVSGYGYARGFAPHNARATNTFRDRTAVAYLVNRYLNPIVKNYLNKFGITADENAFALCEMLQFIWRSAIRDGQPIDLYVPSKRMRTLLIDWLESCEGGRAI